LKDFINIDSPEDDIKDNGLSNKPLNENFYPTSPPSIYNYLDYIDFFIPIQSEGIKKRAITVITAIPVTAGTPLAATTETAVTPGKEAIAVITAIFITTGTPLATTTETTATPGTRLN